LAKPVGAVFWVGPVFSSGNAGCWSCLASRLRDHRLRRYADAQDGAWRSHVAIPSTIRMALGLVATETLNWVADPSASAGSHCVQTVEIRTMSAGRHVVTPIETCEVCGSAATPKSKMKPFVLRSRRKVSITDGGPRAAPPDETFRRFEHH